LKIEDCIKQLESAGLALESAPQKGFVDLDRIKNAIQETGEFLKAISPRLDLGEKLIADMRRSLLARVKVLKESGGGILASQAEQLLESGQLEYEKLIALQNEIERSLKHVFGGYSRIHYGQNKTAINSFPWADDYR
jgi:hypothetical protein